MSEDEVIHFCFSALLTTCGAICRSGFFYKRTHFRSATSDSVDASHCAFVTHIFLVIDMVSRLNNTQLHIFACLTCLVCLVSDSVMYPTGSLFSDCQGVALSQLVAMASSRSMWRARVASLL